MIHDIVCTNYVNPFYEIMGDWLPLIGIAVFLVLTVLLAKAISRVITSKFIKNEDCGTTNTWFSWEEYIRWRLKNYVVKKEVH